MFNKSTTAFKSLAVLAFATAAVASQALSFTTEQIGNFSATTTGGTTTFSSTFNVFATQSNPAGVTFNNGTLTYTEVGATTPAGTAFSGVIRVTGNTSADFLEFAVRGSIFGGSAEAESLAGTAVLTSEGGTFSSYSSGGGNLSTQILTQNTTTNGRTGTTFGAFSADVQAVPEPISMAALGLGIVGLIARRRKA